MQKKKNPFLGYAQCFKAIYHKDCEAFYQGFDVMMKGHKRLCHPYGMFGNSADEVLAIWPLAVVNLARFKGLDVIVNHPLVPQELVTKQLGGL